MLLLAVIFVIWVRLYRWMRLQVVFKAGQQSPAATLTTCIPTTTPHTIAGGVGWNGHVLSLTVAATTRFCAAAHADAAVQF